jgi:hypothetical protein
MRSVFKTPLPGTSLMTSATRSEKEKKKEEEKEKEKAVCALPPLRSRRQALGGGGHALGGGRLDSEALKGALEYAQRGRLC